MGRWFQRTVDEHLGLRIEKEPGEKLGKKGSRGGGNQRNLEGCTGTSEPQWGRWAQTMQTLNKNDTKVILEDPQTQLYQDQMKTHVLICKFMGLWPMKRTLCN
jgi:hypothetical protein